MNFLRNIVQNMNKLIAGLAFLTVAASAFAQNGTNSPYSQYGYGDLTNQSVGFNKGMNGVGLAMRKGNEVNPLNPASYSAVDSLTMIFDGGLYGESANFKENNKTANRKTGGFDYFSTLLRLFRNVGLSAGVMPYSNVGFDYAEKSKQKLGDETLTVERSYSGSGGFSQIYLGMGWRILKPLSVGFNAAYLFGDIRKEIEEGVSTEANYLFREYEVSVSSYKLDFGIQFEQPIGKNDLLTIGATFSPGHSLKADPTCRMIMTSSLITRSDTTSFTITDGLKIPTSFGVGLAYTHASKLRVGADFHLQKWGSMSFPSFSNSDYVLKEGLLKDRYQVNVGAEFMPNPMSRRLFGHIRYRIGAGYTTPYYNINGQNGPKDLSVSLGLGIPIANSYNNRSILNISGQWVRRTADNLLSENMFRICIGLTFNERWFAKWKVE